MIELTSSSDFSWLPKIDAPVVENMIGDALWPNGVDAESG